MANAATHVVLNHRAAWSPHHQLSLGTDVSCSGCSTRLSPAGPAFSVPSTKASLRDSLVFDPHWWDTSLPSPGEASSRHISASQEDIKPPRDVEDMGHGRRT